MNSGGFMRNIKLLFLFYFFTVQVCYSQNLTITSYYQARNILEEVIYQSDEERITLYCQAQFDEDNNVTLPDGFTADSYLNRLEKIEWEHVVPAENFGRSFTEWRDGHPLCIDDEGEPFNGRACAELTSEEYRMMAYDLHNLYPAIGAVNASRSNYNFAMLPDTESDFGTCEMKIDKYDVTSDRTSEALANDTISAQIVSEDFVSYRTYDQNLSYHVEPPEHARGIIARAYLYMEATYPRYQMSDQQRQLMNAWNRMYLPTEWEMERNKRIQEIQGNVNEFIH